MNAIITSEAVTGQLGDQLTITDYASNEYLFSVVLEDRPAPPQQTTLVCADWTAYFVDTAIPGTGLEEGYPGEHFAPAFAPGPMPEEYQRLRSHDAAFASFTLQVRGAFASFATSGHLDADGCVEVPSTALIYDEAAQPGSPNGGVALHMQMTSRFVRETSAGDVEFQVSGPVIALTTFGFNRFENGPHPFAVVDGLRMPPALIDIAGPQWNHRTTVAATVSRTLQELDATGVELPVGTYRVHVGEGTPGSGTRDHLCRHVPDSYASSTSKDLFVGPGHFPCATSHGPRTCDQPCTEHGDCASGVCSEGFCALAPAPNDECRLLCSDNHHCPGGQHCAQADDVDQGCDGGLCYCAWPGQGTMKYVTAHELGHTIQYALLGGDLGREPYGFSCPELAPGQTCDSYGRLYPGSSTSLVDPPGMDPLCGCQHVENSNAQHCLQSVERTSAAQLEGYAQYFAAKVWNGTESQCMFAYYKEFLDVQGECRGAPGACRDFVRGNETWTLTEAPIPLDCNTPPKWRNTHGCGVDPLNQTAPTNDFAQSHGTEYDWMTFLRGVERAGVPFQDIMSVYNHACHPENRHFYPDGTSLPQCQGTQSPADGCYAPTLRCGDNPGYQYQNGNPVRPRPIYWLDRAASFPGPIPPQYDRGGFLDGARRKWGEGDLRTTAVEALGFDHGVDENVAP